MELSLFNVNHGFAEALLRGMRSGFLTVGDYGRMKHADSLEDLRSALEETDYGSFLQDEPSPLLTSTVVKKAYEKLADEFRYLKAQSVEPLTTFMDFIAREKMIDNVCMIIQGALNNKAPAELQEKINPLGRFDGMNTIMGEKFDVTGGFDDLYRIFLVETPIGPYFEAYLAYVNKDNDVATGVQHTEIGGILTKQDLELMKAMLKKAWLEDFHAFCQRQGGTTAETMGHMLKTEADFRVLLLTVNAMNPEAEVQVDMAKRWEMMYPSFGYFEEQGSRALSLVRTDAEVQTALEPFGQYKDLYTQVKSFYEGETLGEDKLSTSGFQSLEDLIYKGNVHIYEMAFEQQYHFGVFYAWVKLREQEVRNVRWIAEMVVLDKKEHIDSKIIPIFKPRE
jgi:V-type H+-transporting ATPase subunit d